MHLIISVHFCTPSVLVEGIMFSFSTYHEK